MGKEFDKHIVSWKGESSHFKVPALEGIREAQKKRLVIVLLVSGDESHDETKQRVYAVTGLIGTQEEWDELMPLWLDHAGKKPFHAVDCDSDQGDYKDNSHIKNKKLYKDMVTILADSKIQGFGQAMDIQGWRKYFPDTPRGMSYVHCFERVVRHFAKIGCKYNKKVDFIFDHNLEVSHNASYLFHKMAKSNEWEHPQWLGSIKYESKLNQPELQVACLFARECMKHVDNLIGPIYRHTRKSMQALLDTGRFECQLMNVKYWEDFRRDVDETAHEIYKKWLTDKKLNDNLTNRIKYVFAKDIRDKLNR